MTRDHVLQHQATEVALVVDRGKCGEGRSIEPRVPSVHQTIVPLKTILDPPPTPRVASYISDLLNFEVVG